MCRLSKTFRIRAIPKDAAPTKVSLLMNDFQSLRFAVEGGPADNHLRRLVDQAHDLICQVDLGGIIRYVNPAPTQALGYVPGQLLGRSLFEFVHADDLPIFSAALEIALLDHGAGQLEHRWRRAGGGFVWLETRVQVLSDGWGQPRGAIFYSRDITRSKQLEAELAFTRGRLAAAEARVQQLTESAQAAERAKIEFLALVSHELRTPLTGLLGGLSLVLEGLLNSPEEQHEFIQLAHRAGYHLLDVINQMLETATLEAGGLSARLQPVAAEPVLRDVVGILRPLAQRKGLQLKLQLTTAELRVQADPNLLRHILLNLVGNAIKFTETGQVEVSQRLAGDRMLFSVEDTGIGIALGIQSKLFQPFVQGDSSATRRHSGTGLGLYLSRRLAELMGGRLHLHSDGEGLGTRLVLELPLAPGGDYAAYDGVAED